MLEPFDLYTPGMQRLYSFEFRNEQWLLTAEVRRTLAGFGASARDRVDRGLLTAGEVKQEELLWSAIGDDLAEQDRWIGEGSGKSGWSLADRLRELRAANGIAWNDKVAALRREIAARRTGYGRDIDKGLLTRDTAKQQLERLEAVHDLYWRHAFAFDLTSDELRAHGEVVVDHALHENPEAA